MGRLALLLLLPQICGCYILTQAQGQLRVLLNSERISKLLADPAVPDAVKLKLLFVREIKAFGEHDLGLKRSSNYETFYDTKGRPITYIACVKPLYPVSQGNHAIMRAMPGVTFRELHAGHNAPISAPDLLADELMRVC